mmetsp:Transcript_5773/g.11858  ORF Transcript_5773/g.11858 Transcript_5773/m.11858 type:complete len:83 (+) Transcript_5773:713-961(+)
MIRIARFVNLRESESKPLADPPFWCGHPSIHSFIHFFFSTKHSSFPLLFVVSAARVRNLERNRARAIAKNERRRRWYGCMYA